ncbi:MAG TPA: efflux RND transporter periplasmic adaptor subunit [Caulobacteraceae bacterium]|nr:efflux RND transporter periplasmic adaptor subunit [Caulobacteraceae bacterium]
MKRLAPMTKWGMAAAMAAMLTAGLAACAAKAPPPAAQDARSVSVVRVQLKPIAGGIVTSGVLIPRNEVAINPDLSGYRVSRLYVDEGDWVKAGQPLAEMDSSILRAQLDQQLALAAQQKANAAEREKEAARVRGLDNQGVIAEEQLQQRFYAASAAQATVNAQMASVKEMQTRLAHMIVRAPVSGLVIKRNVNLGDISGGAAQPWFLMAQDGQIELNADVAEADFGKMHPGVRAKVTLADASTADGVVRLVSPSVDTNSRLGKVRISLPVRPDIRSGGYARASFVDLTRAVASVPETAVRYDANGASVMVVGADNRLSQVPVKTGDRGDGYVELLSGPPPGTVVVAKAAAQFLPGDHVTPDWVVAAAGP